MTETFKQKFERIEREKADAKAKAEEQKQADAQKRADKRKNATPKKARTSKAPKVDMSAIETMLKSHLESINARIESIELPAPIVEQTATYISPADLETYLFKKYEIPFNLSLRQLRPYLERLVKAKKMDGRYAHFLIRYARDKKFINGYYELVSTESFEDLEE